VRGEPQGRLTASGDPDALSAPLFADSEFIDDGTIPLEVGLLEVIEKASPATDELQQAAAAVMILGVRLEVLSQVGNPAREERDLHFRRSRIALVSPILGDNVCLLLLGGRQIKLS
jgi:hypothetical protein